MLPQTAQLPAIQGGQQVTVRVPATSANLGPGYDSLGLALTLHDTLTVESLDSGELLFELSGEGAESLPRDASHLVVRAMNAAFERLGYRHNGLKITAENVSPHGRGLGSSAAAVVAAVTAANALLPSGEQQDRNWILQLTSEMEGHPDNVAPAIFGGLALSWQDSDQYSSTCATVNDAVIPIVAVPDYELSTEAARALLPASVGHHAAAMNSGRAALLIHALTQQAGTPACRHRRLPAPELPCGGNAAQCRAHQGAAPSRARRRCFRRRAHRPGARQRRGGSRGCAAVHRFVYRRQHAGHQLACDEAGSGR